MFSSRQSWYCVLSQSVCSPAQSPMQRVKLRSNTDGRSLPGRCPSSSSFPVWYVVHARLTRCSASQPVKWREELTSNHDCSAGGGAGAAEVIAETCRNL